MTSQFCGGAGDRPIMGSCSSNYAPQSTADGYGGMAGPGSLDLIRELGTLNTNLADLVKQIKVLREELAALGS